MTLDRLALVAGSDSAEVIVAASGDRATTAQACAQRAELLWPGGSTRAELMNAGASVARGEVLWFLHADSLPPPGALARIRAAFTDERVVGGAFEHRFIERDWSLRFISWVDRCRYRITGNHYGDQGLFVRADVFRRLGGFPDVGLMEDLLFVQRLKRAGRMVLLPVPLPTSGRRFLMRGAWRTAFTMAGFLVLHACGVDVGRFGAWARGPIGLPPGSPWPPRRER